MEAVLAYIEKYKFAIMGTVVIHLLFFFYANFTTVKRPFRMPDPTVEMTLPLENVDFDPEILKELSPDKMSAITEEIYNVSADANDTRHKSYKNFSTQEMDEQVENDAKNLEKQYFEEWGATHSNRNDNSSTTDIELEKNKKDQTQNNVDRSNINEGGANAFAGEVMVSFNLKNRKAHSLPRPGYTCNNSGTVVINVKVDKSGSVKAAAYNSSLSRLADECMISKAIRYAKKSRFDFSSSAPGSQSGTLTYKFVGK